MGLAPDVMASSGLRADLPRATGAGSYVPGELVGGPLGRHARRGGWWTTLSVLVLATVLTCLAGYAQKLPCRDVGNWSHNYQYTRVCYSDVIPLYSSEKLSDGKIPYRNQAVEYPILIGAAMEAGAVAARAAPASDFSGRSALFFDATAILLTLAAVAAVICTALSAGRRRMDAMLLAAAPLLAFHAFTNWDLLAVAFTAGALLAWSRRAPAIAGVLLGLGAATKAYPLLLLVALGLLAYRAGRMRAWARCAAWAVGVLVGIYAISWPFAGSYVADDGTHHNNLWRFVELNRTRGADWDSVGYVLQYLGRTVTSGRVIAVSVIVGFLVVGVVALWRQTVRSVALATGVVAVLVIAITQGVSYARVHGSISYSVLDSAGIVAAVLLFAGVGVIVLTAPRRPRVPQVAFLIVVSFLLANKVDSPQYSLWLLPLAVLAYPRWRPLLAWQLVEIYEVVMRYLWFVYQDSSAYGKTGVGEGWFVSAVVLRQLALIVLSALIIREIYRPQLDLVRRSGMDDPAGGVLDGVPDRRSFA